MRERPTSAGSIAALKSSAKESRGDGLPRSWREAIVAGYGLAGNLDMPDTEKVRPDDRFYVWVPNARTQQASE